METVAKISGRLEAYTSTSESKIHHTQQSRKKTMIAEMVKKLIHQFDTHPNRDSLMDDLIKTEESISSAKSRKEYITSMGNTEYFELCEISSEIQCPDCSLYWEVGIVCCTCGKCMQSTERSRQLNEARYDVLLITIYVIKKNPSHQPRHGPTESQRIYYKAHNMLRQAGRRSATPYWKDSKKILFIETH